MHAFGHRLEGQFGSIWRNKPKTLVKFGNPITAKYHRDVILSIKTITCVILAGVVIS